MRATFLYFY